MLAPSTLPRVQRGILVLAGYGLRVVVHHRHLVVSDGIGRDRRLGRFSKATSGLARLVVLGHTGIVSLEALQWLNDMGAGFTQIDADGKVIAAWGPVISRDPQLLRQQALAASNGVGLELARDLIVKKLRGQGAVLQNLRDPKPAISVIDQAIRDLKHAKALDRMRLIEAVAGAAYWNAWKGVAVRFARKDQERVPDHWLVFGARVSPLTGSPRNAANPVNALLNYLYGILEAEARIAALAVGLDPGIGVLHADQRFRASFACDLMEPMRPIIDAFVLDMLHTRTFSAGDFFETRQGVCRVLPPLTHLLAETAARWSKAVAPFAEAVAHVLLTTRTSRRSHRVTPTPLTQENRSAGRQMIRRRPPQSVKFKASRMPQACQNCGVILDNRRRQYCNECLPKRQSEMVTGWAEAGQKALARLRAVGTDPAHGGYAGYKRGRSNAEHYRAAIEWKRRHEGLRDGNEFKRSILPRLQSVPLREIAQATGFSLGYCSLVRRGLRVPHQRHLNKLRSIVIRHH